MLGVTAPIHIRADERWIGILQNILERSFERRIVRRIVLFFPNFQIELLQSARVFVVSII